MAGHNKWSKIKNKKGANDAKRGKIWTKISRELTIAVKIGGEDIGSNFRLRKAVENAKANNMPKDTLERAIKRGLNSSEGNDYEELVYEGYGPLGVAVYVEAMTDNRNRSATDIASAFKKNGGVLGKSGSVGYLFEKMGYINIRKNSDISEDGLLDKGLEHNILSIESDEESYFIYCSANDLDNLLLAYNELYSANNIEIIESGIDMVPSNYIKISGDDETLLMKMLDALEDLDDVQKVWSNADFA